MGQMSLNVIETYGETVFIMRLIPNPLRGAVPQTSLGLNRPYRRCLKNAFKINDN